MLREREGEDTGPTATLALEPEGERRGKDDVGVRSYNRGVSDPVACDGLVLDTEVERLVFVNGAVIPYRGLNGRVCLTLATPFDSMACKVKSWLTTRKETWCDRLCRVCIR